MAKKYQAPTTKDKLKGFAKEASVFGIIIVCILGLFLYSSIRNHSLTLTTAAKVEQKIENQDSFILVTGYATTTNMYLYQETLETYIEKNRSTKIFYVNLDAEEDAETFVTEVLGEEALDESEPHTYYIVNGETTKTTVGNPGYYTVDKEIAAFNSAK